MNSTQRGQIQCRNGRPNTAVGKDAANRIQTVAGKTGMRLSKLAQLLLLLEGGDALVEDSCHDPSNREDPPDNGAQLREGFRSQHEIQALNKPSPGINASTAARGVR